MAGDNGNLISRDRVDRILNGFFLWKFGRSDDTIGVRKHSLDDMAGLLCRVTNGESIHIPQGVQDWVGMINVGRLDRRIFNDNGF